ncbi:uncharacterized protein B0H18DRAFT_1020484 [Fomitopsis serialis]|uniref:uncharacterized protein n=1 Tax=Fomitopsis serialis TaxID=139415 RepID=UPI002008A460|nr:uncharacterized protein B0H18DRAFT_1020484 [Neoantrodia serialis]KAH9921617.1 hypothetical protein B0H18DRAFT_1020484 [Neoantrodia serialis]
MYKDRWPIAVYTGLWFRFYVRSSRPMQIHGPPRINHVVRHRDAYEAYSDAGDNASPEPEPQGRGDSAADGQGVRNKGHNSEAISGHRSPGLQVSQVNVGRSSGSNTGTTAASSPCAVRKQNGDFDPVLRFLRSLTPSLEHLGPQFRLAGIRDVERLRTIATWEHPTKWLVEKARVDLFEEEVLRIALDEVRRGQRSL